MSLLMNVIGVGLSDANRQAVALLASQGEAPQSIVAALQAWDQHPVKLEVSANPEEHQRTLEEVDHLLQLTAGGILKPSVQAQARANLSETIVAVDNLFTMNLEEYRRDFINANGLDQAVRANFQADFFDVLAGSIARETGFHTRLAMRFENRAIKYSLVVILGIWGFWKGLTWSPAKRATEETQKNRVSSAHRIDWMHIVKHEEKKRVVRSKELIEARVGILLTTLQRAKVISLDQLVEMGELDKLYRIFSPNAPLRINNVLIADFIRDQNALIQSALHTVVEISEGES